MNVAGGELNMRELPKWDAVVRVGPERWNMTEIVLQGMALTMCPKIVTCGRSVCATVVSISAISVPRTARNQSGSRPDLDRRRMRIGPVGHREPVEVGRAVDICEHRVAERDFVIEHGVDTGEKA